MLEETSQTPVGTNSRTVTKTALKLVQAAALAAALVPLGSVAVETTHITGHFSGFGSGGTQSQTFFFEGPEGSPYSLTLTFLMLSPFADFTVFVANNEMTQSALDELGRYALIPGTCIPIADGTDTCVEFDVTAPPPGDDTWTNPDSMDGYIMAIAWDADTHMPGDELVARIFHNMGATSGDAYDELLTHISYSSDSIDPLLVGGGNNFQTFNASRIPEPATLLLVGTGLGGLLYRRRKKRRT